MAGVVPHHDVAATLISGFFASAATYSYDLVIILGPNHQGDLAEIILSCKGWDVGSGLAAHGGFVQDMLAAPGIDAVVSHAHMEYDHSAAVLIPFVYHYLPGAQVAPLLLNRSMSFGGTVRLFEWLHQWIENSGKDVLLLASVDFSHFLTPQEAFRRDQITIPAMLGQEYHFLHGLNYHYLDSAAAIIIFLMYLEALGLVPEILDHTDASEFLGFGLDETTSYIVIAGVKRPTRLSFVGDLMLHQPQADFGDFKHGFSAIRPILQSADLTIGNLETVLGGGFSCFPLFSAPDEFATALQHAGFNILTTANNHALDQGKQGLLRTIDTLQNLGITPIGTHRSQAERDNITIKEAGGFTFAFLAYSFASNQPIPHGHEYLLNILNRDKIQADIAAARQLADFIIILPHMGYEYETTPRDNIKAWANLMLTAGADIVVASHPHVLQPMGFVDIIEGNQTRRGFVAYSLGNFISSQRIPPTDEGIILHLYFGRVGGMPTLLDYSYTRTWVKFQDATGQPDIIILPVEETIAAIQRGENKNLRQADIIRLMEVGG